MSDTFETGPSCSLHVCSLRGEKGTCHLFLFTKLVSEALLLFLKRQKVQHFRTLGLQGLLESSHFILLLFFSFLLVAKDVILASVTMILVVVNTPDSKLRV